MQKYDSYPGIAARVMPVCVVLVIYTPDNTINVARAKTRRPQASATQADWPGLLSSHVSLTQVTCMQLSHDLAPRCTLLAPEYARPHQAAASVVMSTTLYFHHCTHCIAPSAVITASSSKSPKLDIVRTFMLQCTCNRLAASSNLGNQERS